ncbi:MAG: hypothetical protein ABF238_00870 [Flavobacteriales bacterium]
MKKSNYTGKYTDAFLTEDVSSYDSHFDENFKKYLTLKENEAVYVYSFKENKLLFTKGFENVLEVESRAVNMQFLNSEYDELAKEFVNEYHDRALLYLYNNNHKLKTFSSSVVIKTKRVETPLLLNIQVLNTDSKGNLISIIGRVLRDPNLIYGDIIQYNLNGDLEGDFLFQMNHKLDFQKRISLREIKIIEDLEMDIPTEEIGKKIGYANHRIEEIIKLMLERFSVKTTKDLIEFAKNKQLIPNQFKNYHPPFV